MLSTARVALPAAVETELKDATQFVENIMEFAREDLVGFRRPLAATFAFTAPLVLAFVFQAGGAVVAAQTAAAYLAVAAGGLYLVGRNLWPGLVQEYEVRSTAKRKAQADLRCGFGEASYLSLARPARFFPHENGVFVFADAGDFRTLFFNISDDPEDPRWALYRNGEMNRQVWRWLRLPVSREVVRFTAEGAKHAAQQRDRVNSVDAYEAILVALGEPLDGAILRRSFDETAALVERMV